MIGRFFFLAEAMLDLVFEIIDALYEVIIVGDYLQKSQGKE